MNPIQALIDPTMVEKARKLSRLTESVRSRLPNVLAKHCWVSGIADRQVLITTDSADACSQIRYYQHEILKQVNEEFDKILGHSVTRLRFKVDCRMAEIPSQSVQESTGYDKPTEKQYAKERCEILLQMIRRNNDN